MVAHAANIGSEALDYDIVAAHMQNSNSVVASVLNAVGIDIFAQDGSSNHINIPTNTNSISIPGAETLLNFGTNLTASDIDDTIIGGDGNDTLDGGAGADTITGVTGNDVVVFNALSESTTTTTDVITDFNQTDDVIDLSALSFTGIQSGSASGTVLGYTSSGGVTTISDGSTFEIELTGTYTLTAGDFVF
jgi:hypothetical protein